jgi:hypothetical protein
MGITTVDGCPFVVVVVVLVVVVVVVLVLVVVVVLSLSLSLSLSAGGCRPTTLFPSLSHAHRALRA